jgi:hypothetical protein
MTNCIIKSTVFWDVLYCTALNPRQTTTGLHRGTAQKIDTAENLYLEMLKNDKLIDLQTNHGLDKLEKNKIAGIDQMKGYMKRHKALLLRKKRTQVSDVRPVPQ